MKISSAGSMVLLLATLISAQVRATNYLNPGRQDVITGNTATLYCPFNFKGTWSWTWTRGSSAVAMNSQIKLRDGRRFTSSRVADSCQLQISQVQISDNGTYVCTIIGFDYNCMIELIARERAFIIDPPPPITDLPVSSVIELDITARSAQLLLKCTVHSPFNPQADVLFTRTRLLLNLFGSNFESATSVVHWQSNSALNQYSVTRQFTKADASSTYSCSSYQPVPINRPSNVSDYLSMPSERVDIRDFRLLVAMSPYARVTFDYDALLAILRNRLALFCESQPGALASLADDQIGGASRELVGAAQFGTSQSLFCVVESSPSASVIMDFRALSSTEYVPLEFIVTQISSVDAVNCDANSNGSNRFDAALCIALANASDEARVMLNSLLRNYLRVFQVHLLNFNHAQLGMYRCSATNSYGTSYNEVMLVGNDSNVTLAPLPTKQAYFKTSTSRPQPPKTDKLVADAHLSSTPYTRLLYLLSICVLVCRVVQFTG